MIVEAVCCSVRDAVLAESAGAQRIELCSALEVGGLTPSIGLTEAVCEAVSIPVMVMVRPRAGDFTYDDSEWRVILADARALLRSGAKGLVFGALVHSAPNGPLSHSGGGGLGRGSGFRIDPRAADIAALAPGTCTFHRALDAAADLVAAAEEAMAIGYARVLSSGGKPSALEGALRLAEMQSAGATIVACGKVRAANVAEIVARSGATEVHLGPRRAVGESFLNEIAEFGAQTELDETEVRDVLKALM